MLLKGRSRAEEFYNRYLNYEEQKKISNKRDWARLETILLNTKSDVRR